MKSFYTNNKDNIMRFISLIVAILLWSYVMSEVDPVITRTFYNIPVEYLNNNSLQEKNLTLISSENNTIDVTVKGKRKSINEMTESDISASIDLSTLNYGAKSKEVDVRLSDSANMVENKNPTNITIEIDKIIEREMDLSIETNGDLPMGYILDQANTHVDTVVVKGPKGIVDSIMSLVAKVNISNRKESTLISAPIRAYDKDKNKLSNLTFEPNNSEVELSISKTKEIPIEVNLQGDLPEGFLKERVEVTPANILLSGPGTEIDKIEKITTSAISPRNLFELKTVPISLIIPEGVKLVNSTENFIVRYNSESKISKEITIPIGQIVDPKGEPINQEILKKNDGIIIRVKGEKGLVEALKPTDFSLIGSVNKRLGKAYLRVEAPTGIEVLDLEPSEILLRTTDK